MEDVVTSVMRISVVRSVAKVAVKGTLTLADAARGLAAAGARTLTRPTAKSGPTPDETMSAPPTSGASPPIVEATIVVPATPPRPKNTPEITQDGVGKVASIPPTPSSTVDAEAKPPGLIAIDGIGPKAAAVLEASNIMTLEQLAATDVDTLRNILAAAGAPYRSMDPSSWPDQARRLLETNQ